MKINESVWGLKENWESSTTYPEIKFPSFNNLYAGWDEKKLKTNELLDDSINFIVASGNICDWFYPTYASITSDGTKGMGIGYSGSKIIRGDYIPIFPALFGSGEGSGTPYPGLYREKDWGIQDYLYDYLPQSYGGIAPMVDFDYSKMIFYIYVFAYNAEFTGYVAVGVEDYYDEANTYMTDYPNITSIRYNCYYGDAGARTSPNPTGTQASTQIIYMIPNTIFHLPPTYENDVRKINDVINYQYQLNVIGGAPENGYLSYNYAEADKEIGARTQVYLAYMNPAHWRYEIASTGTNTTGLFPIFTGTKEDIYAKASAFGVYFTGSSDSALNSLLGEDCTDPLVHLPVVVNGMTFGDYKSGIDTTTLLNSTWGGNAREESGYEGNINIDTNDYTEEVPLIKPSIATAGLFNKSYILNTYQVTELANTLNNADEDVITKILDGLKLQGENPMNGIISLKLFPFDVQREVGATSKANIKIGRWDSGIFAYYLPDKGLTQIFDLGTFTIYPAIKTESPTFLDYEPYTTIDCYIPYCGMVTLSPSEVMGRTISVKMTVDFYTGACEAVVYAEGYPIAYKSGNIAIDIPLTGTDASAYAREVLGGIMNAAGTIVGSETAKIPPPVPVTGAKAIGEAFSGFFAPTHFQSTGAATPSCSFSMPQYCYVIINRPEYGVGEYGKTIGWATNISVPLIEMAGGLIKANNPRLDNISATLEEKNLLETAIVNGIILEEK